MVVSDGYVKYKEAEVDRSAIMQDCQNNEKKNSNGRQVAILNFISAKFVMGYPCVRHDIRFKFMVQLFCIFLELYKYHKIAQIHNSR